MIHRTNLPLAPEHFCIFLGAVEHSAAECHVGVVANCF